MDYNIVYHTAKKNLDRKINLENVIDDCATFSFENENYKFQLIFLYPLDREFLDKHDLEQKIANFYNNVLKVDSYALLFKIDSIGIGRQQVQPNQSYLISFKGTVSGKYLETKLTTIVDLLVVLLESYFICIQSEQLKPIYFKLNGQVIIDSLFESQDSVEWKIFTPEDLIYLLGDVTSTVTTNNIVTVLTEDSIVSAEAVSSLTEVAEAVVEPLSEVAEVVFVEIISFIFSLFI